MQKPNDYGVRVTQRFGLFLHSRCLENTKNHIMLYVHLQTSLLFFKLNSNQKVRKFYKVTYTSISLE